MSDEPDNFEQYANFPTVQAMLQAGTMTIEQANRVCFTMLDAIPAIRKILGDEVT